jgi:hypothetical protein
MAVCHLTSIGIKDEALEFSGPQGAHWRAPLSAIRAIGQYRSSRDGDEGQFIAIIIDGSGAWLQAPCNAVGMEQLLLALSQRWGTKLSLETQDDLAEQGYVLWPEGLRQQPLFERDSNARRPTLTETVRTATR